MGPKSDSKKLLRNEKTLSTQGVLILVASMTLTGIILPLAIIEKDILQWIVKHQPILAGIVVISSVILYLFSHGKSFLQLVEILEIQNGLLKIPLSKSFSVYRKIELYNIDKIRVEHLYYDHFPIRIYLRNGKFIRFTIRENELVSVIKFLRENIPGVVVTRMQHGNKPDIELPTLG